MHSFQSLSIRLASLTLAFVGCLATLSPDAFAQGPNQRQKFIGGLLQSLIESQMDRHVPPANQPAPNRPVPTRPQFDRIRGPIKSFSDESTHLIEHLNTHDATSHRLRPLLSDALRIQSATSVLQQQMQQGVPYDTVVAGYRNIDRDWRTLSYRLRNTEALPSRCLACVNQLDGYSQSLCKVMSIQQQVDYRQLSMLCSACSREIGDLLEDVEIELGRSTRTQSLIAAGRRVEQQLNYLSRSIVNRSDYDTLVPDFKRFQGQWSPYAAQLRKRNNRYLERSVRRVDEITYEMHELMRIPRTMDHTLLAHEIKILTDDVDYLFSRISLQMVFALPNAKQTLATADEFHGLCDYLSISVGDRDSRSKLVDDFGYLEEAWPGFAQSFQTVRDPEVHKAIQQVEASFIALRERLGVRPEFDRARAAQLAASLDNLAAHMLADHDRYLSKHPAYTQAFKVSTAKQIDTLHHTAEHLSEGFTGRATLPHLRRDCQELNAAWNAVHASCVQKLRPQERLRLSRLSNEIIKANVELQTLVID